MWDAAWDVVLVTASFLFALAGRHPAKATIYTLILAYDKALAICWKKSIFSVVIWILLICSSVWPSVRSRSFARSLVRLFAGSLVVWLALLFFFPFFLSFLFSSSFIPFVRWSLFVRRFDHFSILSFVRSFVSSFVLSFVLLSFT